MIRSHHNRTAAVVLAALLVTLFASSCAGSGSNDGAVAEADAAPSSENYVSFDDVPEAGEGDEGGAGDFTATGGGQAESPSKPLSITPEVADAVQALVDLRNLVLVGSAEVSTLEGLVAAEPLAAIQAERDRNVAGIEAYARDARAVYQSVTHVLSVEDGERGVLVEFCNEQRGDRIPSGYEILFVHERFEFDSSTEPWLLTRIDTVHDGVWETGGVTCIPPAMADRAVDVASAALATIDSLLAAPEDLQSVDLDRYLGGVALDSIELGLAQPPFSDRRRVTPTEYRFEVVGLDPANSPYVAVVEVCRRFPEGMYDEMIGSGERVLADPLWVEGSSSLDRVRVNLGPKYDYDNGPTDVLWDFENTVEIGCWT